MASPSFIGGALGNNGQSATSGSVAMTPHASSVAGDLSIASFDGASGTITVSAAPTGWTLKSGPNTSGTVNEAWVYYKFLQTADLGASASWTFSAVVKGCGIMDTFRGVDTYLGFDGFVTSNSAVTNTVLTANNVSVAGSGVFIYEVYSARTATTVNTSPTLSANISVTSFCSTNYAAAPNLSMTGTYKTVVPTIPGSYGGDTATYTNTNTNQVLYTMGLPPIGGVTFNNYMGFDVGNGASTTEKIR